MNSARLMLDGRLSTPLALPVDLTSEALPRYYAAPLGFRLDPTGENLLPTYPVGLPLHFAAVGMFLGLEPATTVTCVAAALFFIVLLYFTSREFGVRSEWSMGLALCGAVSPLVIQYALQPMSDLVAAAWSLAVIFSAMRSSRNPRWAAAAGAALAMAVLVRPTNLLLVLPAALALPRRTTHWIAFILGGLPGGLFLAGYNHAVYGSILVSGYGSIGSLFGAEHVLPTLWHYATWLPVVATPLVFAAVALPWLSLDGRSKSVLLTWSGTVFLFYSAYTCTHETWWYLRFVLPALPAVGIAAALALQQIPFPTWFVGSHLLPPGATPSPSGNVRYLRLPITVLFCLAAVGWSVAWSRQLRATQIELDDRGYPLACRWASDHLPSEALLISYQMSGSLLFYNDRRSINFTFFTPEESARFTSWVNAQSRPFYAVLFPHEEEILMKNIPGQWEPVTRIRQVSVWRRTAPKHASETTPRPASP